MAESQPQQQQTGGRSAAAAPAANTTGAAGGPAKQPAVAGRAAPVVPGGLKPSAGAGVAAAAGAPAATKPGVARAVPAAGGLLPSPVRRPVADGGAAAAGSTLKASPAAGGAVRQPVGPAAGAGQAGTGQAGARTGVPGAGAATNKTTTPAGASGVPAGSPAARAGAPAAVAPRTSSQAAGVPAAGAGRVTAGAGQAPPMVAKAHAAGRAPAAVAGAKPQAAPATPARPAAVAAKTSVNAATVPAAVPRPAAAAAAKPAPPAPVAVAPARSVAERPAVAAPAVKAPAAVAPAPAVVAAAAAPRVAPRLEAIEGGVAGVIGAKPQAAAAAAIVPSAVVPALKPMVAVAPKPAAAAAVAVPASGEVGAGAWRRPAFWVVVGVLLAGAVGLNGATAVMKLYFRKEPMALRAPEGLMALPQQLGTWVMIPEAHTVDTDLVHSLGTDQYVFRKYVDLAALPKDVELSSPLLRGPRLDELRAKSPTIPAGELLQKEWSKLNFEEQARVREWWTSRKPEAYMELAVTYYTGKVDTVPHVPDRCYVAGGYQPVQYDVSTWPLGSYGKEKGGAGRDVPVRFIEFQLPDRNRRSGNRAVTYFFHANGQYLDDPNSVRMRLQSLSERYAYFAKIEVMSMLPTRDGEDQARRAADRQQAEATHKAFLEAALPAVERILPEWPGR